ncbi:MAG TPA: DUF493 domain-containing protein [Anaeromyxobacteraceae bacterium]|nr:DUF493 domain-containing protein [Anaeromyxobacteraceae bacterium]
MSGPVTLGYPLEYEFKVIALAEDDLTARVRALVERVVGPLTEDRLSARPSAQGKYLAVSVRALLRSEKERRAVYEAFHADGRIVYYL